MSFTTSQGLMSCWQPTSTLGQFRVTRRSSANRRPTMFARGDNGKQDWSVSSRGVSVAIELVVLSRPNPVRSRQRGSSESRTSISDETIKADVTARAPMDADITFRYGNLGNYFPPSQWCLCFLGDDSSIIVSTHLRGISDGITRPCKVTNATGTIKIEGNKLYPYSNAHDHCVRRRFAG